MYERLFLDDSGKSLLGGLIQTTLVSVILKATGSISRILYSRNDPEDVQQSTKKREAVLLGLTAPLTFFADWVSARFILPLIRHVLKADIASSYQKLLMLPSALLGVILAETIANKLCKRPDWKTAEAREKVKQARLAESDEDIRTPVGLRLNLRSDDTQFRGAFPAVPASFSAPYGPSPFAASPYAYSSSLKGSPASFQV